ncbi:MAG: GIY-YIG nuclease family protein [Pseudomonadota bacterium]
MPELTCVLTNQAMPGLIKIGRTSGPVIRRAKSLDTTRVPIPFECFSAWEVSDARLPDGALHQAFGDHRLREKRKFFRLSPDRPTAIPKAFGIRNVTSGEDAIEDEDDTKSLDTERSQRSNFNFEMMGLSAGAELNSVFDPNVTCHVHDRTNVVFRSEIVSQSAAALSIARESGRNWSSLAGPQYWLFDDVTLSDLCTQYQGEFEDD